MGVTIRFSDRLAGPRHRLSVDPPPLAKCPKEWEWFENVRLRGLTSGWDVVTDDTWGGTLHRPAVHRCARGHPSRRREKIIGIRLDADGPIGRVGLDARMGVCDGDGVDRLDALTARVTRYRTPWSFGSPRRSAKSRSGVMANWPARRRPARRPERPPRTRTPHRGRRPARAGGRLAERDRRFLPAEPGEQPVEPHCVLDAEPAGEDVLVVIEVGERGSRRGLGYGRRASYVDPRPFRSNNHGRYEMSSMRVRQAGGEFPLQDSRCCCDVGHRWASLVLRGVCGGVPVP